MPLLLSVHSKPARGKIAFIGEYKLRLLRLDVYSIEQPTAHFNSWLILYVVIDIILKTRRDSSVQVGFSVGR